MDSSGLRGRAYDVPGHIRGQTCRNFSTSWPAGASRRRRRPLAAEFGWWQSWSGFLDSSILKEFSAGRWRCIHSWNAGTV